jgi:hypothetical protein
MSGGLTCPILRPMLDRHLVALALAVTTQAACLKLLKPTPTPAPTRNLQPGQPGYVDPGPRLGPLHERYAGKVVFSGAPIPLDGDDDSSVYTTYPLGQPLYLRYWSATSPHNLLPRCNAPRIILRADVDGAHAGAAITALPSFGDYELPRDDLMTYDASSLSNDLQLAFTTAIPYDPSAREEAGRAAVRQFNGRVIPQLADGTHQLRVLVTLDCGASSHDDPIVADGTVTVVVPAGGVTAYLREFGVQLAPSPHPANAALVPEILEAMRREPDWDNEELIGAQVTSPDWIPVRDEDTSVLIGKKVEAALIVRARKETHPEACRLFDMSYYRDVAGGPLRRWGTGSSTPFPCGNAPR